MVRGETLSAPPDEAVGGILAGPGLARDIQPMAPPDFNRRQGQRRVELSADIQALPVTALADEVHRAAKRLGGAAASWPARYGLD